MITGIRRSRTLTKHASCKCECKFDSKQCYLNQTRNDSKCWCECKNKKEYHLLEKGYFWNPATRSCKNGIYIGIIIDDSVIKCDEIGN